MESEICSFADNTTIYSCDANIDSVIVKLERDRWELLEWYTANSMSANSSKFQIMVLGTKRKNNLFLNSNRQLIPPSQHIKLLGVTIDNTLKFDTHVHGICKKVNQTLHAFGRLKPYIGNDKSNLLLNAVVLSNFSYCILIWLLCSKTANNKEV